MMTCYKTKDDRFIQISLPVYDIFLAPFARAMSCEEWITDPRFCSAKALHEGNIEAFYQKVSDRFAQLTVEEVTKILNEADLPFALAQVWEEVLCDPQAWASDCFTKLSYPSGERIMIRGPIRFEEAGLPEYDKAPGIGQHTEEILTGLGYDRDTIMQMAKNKEIRC